MRMMTLAQLYLVQLQDMHGCERYTIRILPKMAKAAYHPQLRMIFNRHLVQTTAQLQRLTRILSDMGKRSDPRQATPATIGLMENTVALIHVDADEEAGDAAMICAARKFNSYKIASYDCLRTIAMTLGRPSAVEALDVCLEAEITSDQALTELATDVIHANAML